jgi:hypothetical protein
MTTRTPLDLRGKTMTELMEMDAEIGSALDSIETLLRFWPRTDGAGNEEMASLLADRRQIRARMEELGGEPCVACGGTGILCGDPCAWCMGTGKERAEL